MHQFVTKNNLKVTKKIVPNIDQPAPPKLSIKIGGEKVTDLKAFLELKKFEREKTRPIPKNRATCTDNNGKSLHFQTKYWTKRNAAMGARIQLCEI